MIEINGKNILTEKEICISEPLEADAPACFALVTTGQFG
jgi:hypothetical protein